MFVFFLSYITKLPIRQSAKKSGGKNQSFILKEFRVFASKNNEIISIRSFKITLSNNIPLDFSKVYSIIQSRARAKNIEISLTT